ncbi:hypothetical protein QTO34_004515, partial [Cnephaeus nilssonii]
MEQEDEALSQWQAAQHQFAENTEKSVCILDMSPSPGSSRVHILGTMAHEAFNTFFSVHSWRGSPWFLLRCPGRMVVMTFSENLSNPPMGHQSQLPVKSHIRTPTMPYSGHPTVPFNSDSLTPKMLLPSTMPSSEGQARLSSLAQMLSTRDPHNVEYPQLESQDSFVSQPASQEDPFHPERPIPTPQSVEQKRRALERAPRRALVARPYCCQMRTVDKLTVLIDDGKQDCPQLHTSDTAFKTLDLKITDSKDSREKIEETQKNS